MLWVREIVTKFFFRTGLTNNPGGGIPQAEQFMKTPEFVDILGNDFLIDTEHVNNGYPILSCPDIVTNIPNNINNNLNVYPNPTTGIVYIETESLVKIYNVQGILLKETFGKEVDLSTYSQGFYFLQIENKIFKILKK